MKITLIKPNIGRLEHSLYVDEGRMEPLQLGLLAGLTPPDIEVGLFDDRCEAIPYDDPTDLVAITVETFTARRAYEIAAKYRARGVRVVLGGFHPTLAPEEAALHADSIVRGDAETVWRQLIDDTRRDVLKPEYLGEPGSPQPGCVPRRDLFRGKNYLPITLMQFGRGCRYGCRYCAISSFFCRHHHSRPVNEVIGEIEGQNRRLVFFVDDNIVADHEAAKELFRALIPLKIRWVSQASLDMVDDPELMDLMVRSGCLGHVIGFETLSPEGVREMAKTPNLSRGNSVDHRRSYEEAIRILKGCGLQTWAAFLLGLDSDTKEGLSWQLDFALKHRFTFAAFNVLMPYPATPLYDKLSRAGRLLYDGKWWVHPAYRFNHAAFRPARMSADELTQIAFESRARFSSPGAILRRFFDLKTNLRTPYRAGLYWAYNPLFRREVFKKQGMQFGSQEVGL